jgi:transposase
VSYRENIAWRRNRVLELTRAGCTISQIAKSLGVTYRTIERDRLKLGLAKQPRPMTEEELTWARAMLEDGCPYAEVARTLRRNVGTITDRFPGYGSNDGQLGRYYHDLRRKIGV